MARQRKHAPIENHERWLISYADFITLLFAFFVVMFASSQTDKTKAKQVSEAVEKAFDKTSFPASIKAILGGTVDDIGKGNAQMKGPGGSHKMPKLAEPPERARIAELIPSMEFLSKELEEEIRTGKMQLHLEARGLVITLSQATFFPSGGDAIAPATFGSIEKVARSIQRLPNPVRLEGHTDSIPIHSVRFRSNWDLSAARGIAMLQILNDLYGIPRNRLAVAGYAETMPVETNDSETGRSHNRRVDIVILNKESMVKEPSVPDRPAGKLPVR